MKKSSTFSPMKSAAHARQIPFYMTKGFRCLLAIMLAMTMSPIGYVAAFAEGDGETPSAETPTTGEQQGDETPGSGEQQGGETSGAGEQSGDQTPGAGEQSGDETPGSGEQSGDETPGAGEQVLTDAEAQAICPSIAITSAANYATTTSEGTNYLTPDSEEAANTKTVAVVTTAGTGGEIQSVVVKDNDNVVSAPDGVVTIDDNNAHVITVEVTDAAGNKTVLDAEGKTTLTIGDKTYAGVSTIKDGNGNALAAAKFVFNIFGQTSVTNAKADETNISKSRKNPNVRYIKNGGKVALTVTVKSVDDQVSIDGTFGNSAWSKSFDADKQEVTFTYNITTAVTGPIQYSVSGHGVTTESKTIYAYSLKSDNQAPVISFSSKSTSAVIDYPGAIPSTDPVYKEAVALLSNQVDVEITITDDQSVDEDSITVYVNNEAKQVSFKKSGNSYKGTVTVENKASALASYYIKVTASDDAGASTTKYMTQTVDEAEKLFLIVADNEAPTATCNNAPSAPQSVDSYELTYTVADNFAFDPTKSGWGNYVVTDNGSVLGEDKVKWSQDPTDSNKWAATVTVAGEGTHAITFKVTDAAGNPASAEDQTVILDKTAPTMEIKGSAGVFRDGQKVAVEVTEANFGLIADDTAIAKIEKAVVVDGEYSDVKTLTRGDFKEAGGKWYAERTLDAEGIYRVVPVAFADAAGNPLDVSAVTPLSGVIIDKTAPTVTCDNAPSAPQSVDSYELTYTVSDNFAFDPTKSGWGNYVVTDNGSVLGEDKVKWSQDPTDSNKWAATVTVAGEGTHAITFKVTDAAGNPASAEDQTVILDKTAPTMEIKGSAGVFGDGQKVAVEVTEANFGLIADDTAIAKIEKAVVVDGEYSGTYTDVKTLTKGDFKEAGGKWYAERTLDAEGSYRVVPVAFADAAGNPLDVSAVTPLSGVIIDKTAPTVTVEFKDSFAQNYNGVDYFYDAQEVSVSVADMNFVPTEGFEKSGVDDKGVAVYTKKTYATFGESEGNTLSVSFTDAANHTTSGSYGTQTDNLVFKAGDTVLAGSSFTIDTTAPEITSASVGTSATNAYVKSGYTEAFFNTGIALIVEASDNLGLAPKSGAENAGYQVEGLTVNGGISSTLDDATAAAKSATIKIALADATDESGSNEVRSNTLVTLTDLAGNYRTWSIDENGTYVLVREGNPQTIGNTGVDPLADFNNRHPSALIQDTVAPNLTLSAPEAGSYVNYHPTVTLGVTEMNFRYIPKATQILTEEKSNSYGGDGTTVYSASEFSGSNGSYTYTSRALEDGHYVLNASVTDAAGNQSNKPSAEFTVDTIAPTIDVTWDNNDVRNGKYYNRGRTATITIVERNFEGGSANWTIDAPGASISGWSSSGDVHTATVTFSNDGEYTMSVSGQDAAGNALPTYTADPFVVDQTAPRVEFGGVSNNTAYAGTVAPTISFIDEANLDTNGNSHQLSGSKNGGVSYENGTSESSNTLQTVTYSDFQHVPGYDDIYTITATAKDLAGNTADGTITFSVNRYGSNFRVVDVEQYEDNDGILGERQDIQFEEINVSGVETPDSIISIARGASEATNLKDGEGYEITSGTSSDRETNGWTRYVYTVKEDNFDKDGKYTVSISSKTSVSDAEQLNTSVSYFDRYYDLLSEEEQEKEDQYKANCELTFILDETAPEIVSLNIADGAMYDASTYQGQFTVVEDTGLKTDNGVVVTVDGKEVNVESDKYGNYTFNVEAASFTSRNLNIVVTDKAGHQATVGNYDGNHAAEKVEFHVTTNILELHLPIVLVVAAIVIIAAAGGIVVIRRKMNQLDEAEGVN